MTTKAYQVIALAAYLVATFGSNLIAQTTVGGQTFAEAVVEHLQWAPSAIPGLIILFGPFWGLALIGSGANKRARTRSAGTIFFVSLAILSYFYFEGFQASQHALLEKKWTAAALSVGLLPFFIGIPLLIAAVVAAAIASVVDRRSAA